MTEIDVVKLRRLAENAKESVDSHVQDEFWDACGINVVLALLDRLEQADAAIERVRTVHRKETRLHDWEVCTHCAVGMLQDPVDWPCDTIAALDTGKEKNA